MKVFPLSGARLVVQPFRYGQAALGEKRGVVELAHLTGTRIAEDGDDGVAGAELPGQAHGAEHVDARRAPRHTPSVRNRP
jgi:hypothetical protein